MRVISVLAFIAASAVGATWAAKAPADPCSLLPAAEVSKALNREMDPPKSTVAPRPYKNTAEGTDCVYKTKGGGRGALMFRIYFDASPAESTELQAKLKMFYGMPSPVPGVGDETYLDSKHGLHARKGNVRFYLELMGVDVPTLAKDKQLTNLAVGIVGRL